MAGLAPKSSPLTIRYLMTTSARGEGWFSAVSPRSNAIQREAEDLCRDTLGVEMSLRQPSRCAAMHFVVGINNVERRGGLPQSCEAEHTLAIRQERARSGVLHHDRFAAGQVTHGPISHPCILKLHTRRFGTTKFAARVLDVCLILFGGGRDLARVTNSPAALFQLLPFLQVSWIFHEQRQFKGLPRQPRQIGKLEERDPLR